MRNIENFKLTKSFIESKVSQIQIMSVYLDIPIATIEDCVNKGKLIKSVFRDDDENGSMGFTYNNKGKLKVRDFGGFGFFGDVYDVVSYVLQQIYKKPIDTKNKADFYLILKHISRTFSKIIYGNERDENINKEISDAISALPKKPIIELVTRDWNNSDRMYWRKYNLDTKYLNTHFVIPVDQFYINRNIDNNPKYKYNKQDPCYAYIIGRNKAGVLLMKLYFPYRDRRISKRFITNCCVLEGLLNLELDNYDYILITKSSKDRICIGSYLSSLLYGGHIKKRIGVINVPSENYRLNETEYNYLMNKLEDNGKIITLFDFDYTGRTGAKYMYNQYEIPYLFITNGMFGLKNFRAKDFTDLHEVYTKEQITKFVLDTIEYVESNKFKDRYEHIQLINEQALLRNSLPY